MDPKNSGQWEHHYGPFLTVVNFDEKQALSFSSLSGCVSNDLFEIHFLDWEWIENKLGGFVRVGEHLVDPHCGDSCYCMKFGDCEPHGYRTECSGFTPNGLVKMRYFREGIEYKELEIDPEMLEQSFKYSRVAKPWPKLEKGICPKCGAPTKNCYDRRDGGRFWQECVNRVGGIWAQCYGSCDMVSLDQSITTPGQPLQR